MKIAEIRALKPYDYIKHSKLGVCIVHKFIQDSGLVLQQINTANFILERSNNRILNKLSRNAKWRVKNKEKVKAYKKVYYQEHKEKRDKYSRKYYNEHKEKILAYHKEYNSKPENIERTKKRGKAYYQENKEVINKQSRAYQKEHSEELKAKREKLNQDPEYAEKQKQMQNIRSAE